MKTISVRNVNGAISELVFMMRHETHWINRTARGTLTREWPEPVVTEYSCPTQRVSFCPARDANPFFHLFESLWILAGRKDVGFLRMFNRQIAQYSDDGITFHAPYGHRLRRHFGSQVWYGDQIMEVVFLMKKEPDTRRAVMMIWDPKDDLNFDSKDIPCNDAIFFKARSGGLDMTVCCRSNDAIWGAYGANAVQFSVLQEFVASALGMYVGVYRQISDSFHVYPDIAVYERLLREGSREGVVDLYLNGIHTVPLLDDADDWLKFLECCESFCNSVAAGAKIEDRVLTLRFFNAVVIPMWEAWKIYKNEGAAKAVEFFDRRRDLENIDWHEAGIRWMIRRVK